MVSHIGQALLLGVFVLSTSIWVGGYVAIAVMARTATATLAPQQRVAFFRQLGRFYLRVGVAALVVALGAGAGLLRDRPWDGALATAAVLAVALVVALCLGVAQARQMTHLRLSALAAPGDPDLARRVRNGARSAVLQRATIGLLTLALIILGSLIAT